jgi:hypothetical protein
MTGLHIGVILILFIVNVESETLRLKMATVQQIIAYACFSSTFVKSLIILAYDILLDL